jgi:DNA-binding beta-propeller fold protein YncE
MKTIISIISIICLLQTQTISQDKTAEYKLIKEIPVDGDGGWDYLSVDNNMQHLFISHGTMVHVVDVRTGKVIGVIPDTPGVHGIALNTVSGKGYISCGRSDSIVIIDINSLQTLSKIASTGKNPDAIIFDPFTKRVFAFNGRSSSITAIETVNDGVVGTIPVPGKPEFSVSDGKGNMYVNIEDKNTIVKFSPKDLKVLAEWPLSPGEEPTGLAMDVKNNRLFSACSGSKQLVVLNAIDGKIVQVLPIGASCDGAVFIPEDKNVITSNGEGTITVIHQDDPDHYRVIQTLQTRKGARTITYDPGLERIYLPCAEVKTDNGKRSVVPGTFRVVVVGKGK